MLCLIFSQALSSTFAVFHLTLVFKGFTALVPQGPDEPNPLFSRVFEADARKTAKVELNTARGKRPVTTTARAAATRSRSDRFRPAARRRTWRSNETRTRGPRFF